MTRSLLGLLIALLMLSPALAQVSPDSTQPDSVITQSQSDSVLAPAMSTDSSATADSTSGGGILMKDGQPLYPLSPERKALLSEYADMVNLWRFVELFSGLLILAIILFTGLSARIRDWAKSARLSYFTIWLYCAILLVAMSVLSFPFDYYRDYHLEVQFGFMNQSFGEWFGEQLISLAVMVVVMPIPVWFLYFVIQRFKRWWLAFSIGAFPIMVIFVVIAPVLISPLFNQFEPLKDKQLEQEILTLASKAGIEGSDVFEVDASKQSSKVNAYVTGLLNTKRIVLYDTLIKGFTYNEIKFVMGHEMGHYLMKHIWWGLGLLVFYLVAILWLTEKTAHGLIQRWRHTLRFERLSDIASLPLLMALFTIFSFFLQPIQTYASRYMEHQSDIFGMDVTDISGDEAASAFDKLSAYNLSDPDPHPLIEFWFYDHPALKSRMAFVKQYRIDHPVAER
ncbi:MAG: M48 family metallopeptidase [bacterium]|nr:M48 family metallopeptidase [bacterium]